MLKEVLFIVGLQHTQRVDPAKCDEDSPPSAKGREPGSVAAIDWPVGCFFDVENAEKPLLFKKVVSEKVRAG